MGHNSVVSGHPKSTGIPRVDDRWYQSLGKAFPRELECGYP